jgi:hypothetical protein
MGSISAASIAQYIAASEEEREERGDVIVSQQEEGEKGKEEEKEKEKEKKKKHIPPSLQHMDPTIVTDVIIESGFATSTFLSDFMSRIYANNERSGKSISPEGRKEFERRWMKRCDLTSSFASFAASHRPSRHHVVTFLHSEDDRVVTIKNLEENVEACEKTIKEKREEREKRVEGKESEQEEGGSRRKGCEVFRSGTGQHNIWVWRAKEMEDFLDGVL